jgi:AraC-like DNA-binding protein
MTIRNRAFLERINPFLDLSFSQISIVNFDYHNTNIFPVDIMILVLEDDGRKRNYLEHRAEHQHLPLRANYVYFLPCNQEIRFEITPGITFIALHFNLEFFHGIDIFSGSRRCEMRHDPKFIATIHSVFDENIDDLKAACILKAEVLRFCVAFWPENTERIMKVTRKYEQIFRFVREQGDAELTVAAMAKMAGQRQDVFSRNFSRDIGKSPKEFLQNDLLKKIITRLLVPQASIKETAAELNFSSEFYMSHFFKKHTGLSPSEYQSQFRYEHR